MAVENLYDAARSLFASSAMAAGMDLLVQKGRLASAFRVLCALAVAVRALRLVARLIGG